jgi:glycerol-3-phosphate dehydrogenase (NAD(P)+)
MSSFDPIGIVGAGAFGTALAIAAARAGRKVLLYGRDTTQMAAIASTRINAAYLPDIILPSAITITSNLDELGIANLIILATPAQSTRAMVQILASIIKPNVPLIITSKGIERETGLYPSEIAAKILANTLIALLSGPSFAADVARGFPTAVALACADIELAEQLAKALNSSTFRIYHTSDTRGVEIGGAAKNVLAIAAGIVDGQGLGESAKATLIARGFAEMGRFAQASGAKMETLMGLSGLGDLVLTCGSDRSRNFKYGKALGSGSVLPKTLVEGAYTAQILVDLAHKHGVEMPICAAVAAIIAGEITVKEAILQLTARPQRGE